MLKVSFLAIFVSFIVAVYLFSRQYLTPGFAFLATLITLLHRQTSWMSGLLFAELPFAFVGVLFLLASRSAKDLSRQWIAGVLAVSCYLLRTAGIALLGAWVIESLLKRRFAEMAFRAGVALVPILAWQGYIEYVKHGPEYTHPAYEYQRAAYQYYNVPYLENLAYVDPFIPELGLVSPRLFLKRIRLNLAGTPEGLGSAISVRSHRTEAWLNRINRKLRTRWVPAGGTLPFIALGQLVLAGLVLLARRGEWLVGLYVFGTSGLIWLTPWGFQSGRYWWPLTPILAVAFFTVLVTVKDRLSRVARRGRRIAVLAITVAIASAFFSMELVSVFGSYKLGEKVSYRDDNGKEHRYLLLYYKPDWPSHDEALDWLKEHSDRSGIVATSTPHWAYLKTGLKSVMPPFDRDVHEAQRLMDSVPVSYLILDSFSADTSVDISRRYAAPVVNAFPERWELTYSSAGGDSKIYRRRSLKEEFDGHQMAQSGSR